MKIKYVLLAEAQIWRVPKNECLNAIFINVLDPEEEYAEEGEGEGEEGEHRANPILECRALS